MRPLAIEVLLTPSCPHGGALPSRIEELAREADVEVVVTETILDDRDDAEARRFTGSPTIRVEGRDIEPQAAGEPADYGLG